MANVVGMDAEAAKVAERWTVTDADRELAARIDRIVA